MKAEWTLTRDTLLSLRPAASTPGLELGRLAVEPAAAAVAEAGRKRNQHRR